MNYIGKTSNSKQVKNDGVIIKKVFIKPKGSEVFIEEMHGLTSRIYFFDSCVIFELASLIINEDINQHETYEEKITGYLFHDIGTQSYYKYSSLSDTATLDSVFCQPDTAYLDGTWNFKRGMRPPLSEGLFFSEIGDTLLGDDVFRDVIKRRYQVLYGTSKYPEFEKRRTLLYFQVDSIPSYLTFDQEQSKRIGLPLTRIDLPSIGLNGQENFLSLRVYLERANLTTDEINAFKAWADYAKKNPIK
jgi:hypothetical protein